VGVPKGRGERVPAKAAVRRIDEIGAESRARILDAAEELFAEQGFEKTSFVDIAERCGISRGSIPWHFKNKDGLLLAVVNRVNQRYLSRDQSEATSLDEFLTRYGVVARDVGGRLLFAVLTEAMSSTGVVHEEYKAHLTEMRQRWNRWLKLRGVRSPRKREELAVAIMGSLMGTMLQWQIDPEKVDLDAAFKAIATLVDNHLAN
jgi:TetR/AcrR family transcriptional regulator, acrAB operon repressor